MHLFGVMYDLVDHVVTSQYFSEQRCKTPEQNSKLSPTYRKRAASCDSVGLFQVNIWKLCSNLLHPCWYSVCWSINYRGNLLKIPALTVDFFLPPFKAVSFHSIYLKPQPVHPIFTFPSELTLLSCVAASGATPFRISLCLIPINLFRLVFPWFLFFIFLLLFSHSVVFNSLQCQGLQQARLLCPLYLLEFAQTHVHWVGDAIQPSHTVSPLSSCPQSFPASGSFPMNRLFTADGQSIGASASVSVLPMNIQG